MSRMRLEASENRHEDLAESISQASKPILRQVKAVWTIPIVLINARTFCVGTHNSDPSISRKVWGLSTNLIISVISPESEYHASNAVCRVNVRLICNKIKHWSQYNTQVPGFGWWFFLLVDLLTLWLFKILLLGSSALSLA